MTLYSFPELGVTIQADTLEEATKIVEGKKETPVESKKRTKHSLPS